jgi:hypothetical protein
VRAEDVEEVAGDDARLQLLGIAAAGQRHAARGILHDGERIERVVASRQILGVEPRKTSEHVVTRRIYAPDRDEVFGIVEGQRSDYDAVDDREHGCCRADCTAKAKNGHGRYERRSRDRAPRVTDLEPHCLPQACL